MFFLYKVQTPMSLKAMKVVPVGIQTMTGVSLEIFVIQPIKMLFFRLDYSRYKISA